MFVTKIFCCEWPLKNPLKIIYYKISMKRLIFKVYVSIFIVLWEYTVARLRFGCLDNILFE